MEHWLSVLLGIITAFVIVWLWRRYDINGVYKMDNNGLAENAVVITDVTDSAGVTRKIFYLARKEKLSEGEKKNLTGPVNFAQLFNAKDRESYENMPMGVYIFTDGLKPFGWNLQDSQRPTAGNMYLQFSIFTQDLTIDIAPGQIMRFNRVE